MTNDKNMNRRSFIKAGVAVGALGLGSAVLWQFGGLGALRDSALRQFPGTLYVERLRQIVTENTGRGRVLMWEVTSPIEQQTVEVRVQGEAEIMRRYTVTDEGFTDDSIEVYQYVAELDRLMPGTQYQYRITAGGAATDWQTLYTPTGGEPYKMLIFPDSQSSDYTDWKQLAHLAWARNTDAQLFSCMGDLVDNGEDRLQWTEFFGGVKEMQRSIPVAPVMGNHETYDRNWQVRLPEAYLQEFAVPDNGSEAFSRYYYSFDYGSCHFAVLNTQMDEVADFKQGLLEEQLAWLPKDMEKSRKRWKIALLHKDVLQYRIHQRPERTEGFSDIGEAFMPVFDALGIDLVLTAHLHTYRNRGHIEAFRRSPKGSVYILTGVAGDVRYPNLWVDHALDEAVAPQPETDNYLVLEVKDAQLAVECFLPDGTRIDRVEMVK